MGCQQGKVSPPGSSQAQAQTAPKTLLQAGAGRHPTSADGAAVKLSRQEQQITSVKLKGDSEADYITAVKVSDPSSGEAMLAMRVADASVDLMNGTIVAEDAKAPQALDVDCSVARVADSCSRPKRSVNFCDKGPEVRLRSRSVTIESEIDQVDPASKEELDEDSDSCPDTAEIELKFTDGSVATGESQLALVRKQRKVCC